MENMTRLPALPLIVNDPYLSLWCAADRLTEADATHWAGAVKRIRGEITVDGETMRYLGLGAARPMPTAALAVTPTATEAVYEDKGVRLTLRFTTPLLLNDLDLCASPVTFVDHEVVSIDGAAHEVRLALRVYDDICYDGAARPEMLRDQFEIGGTRLAFIGQRNQKLLCHSGDHVTIDWGYLFLASRAEVAAEAGFLVASQAGRVSKTARVALRTIVAYDDVASIDYFGVPTKAWCFREGRTIVDILTALEADRESVLDRCRAFDEQLLGEARARGGEDYAQIVAAAYRHAIAAHKLIADEHGEPVLLSKENDSNGCIGTVDVSYPSSPLFLKYNPELARALCRAVLRFAEMPVWNYDFAPHDVGRYPHATGQVYGLKGGSRAEAGRLGVYPPYYLYPASADCYEERYQMPVEECGNMLIMLRAAEKADGNTCLAKEHLPLLTKWAGYLLRYGDDPGEQLCTDDFAGHLAHNVNLSAKAIMGVKCFADTLRDLNDPRWEEYEKRAREMAESWLKRVGAEGDTPLTFAGGGWSMKYNLVWDAVLGLGVFPDSFYEKEIASYLKRLNRYGLPLDSRKAYTKSDWILWTAAMSKDEQAFAALVAPVARYLRETASRVPFSDWYDTETGQYEHFIARSVQGGLFMPLL